MKKQNLWVAFLVAHKTRASELGGGRGCTFGFPVSPGVMMCLSLNSRGDAVALTSFGHAGQAALRLEVKGFAQVLLLLPRGKEVEEGGGPTLRKEKGRAKVVLVCCCYILFLAGVGAPSFFS